MTEPSAHATEIAHFLESAAPAMVRAGVEASNASAIVDEIQSSLGRTAGWFDLWAAIDNKIGSSPPELQKSLLDFRSWFEGELAATAVNRIENAFGQSAEDGWREWLKTLAEAVSHFRLVFSKRLCETRFPFRETDREHVEQLRSCVNYMSRGQWMESYKYLNYLGKHEWLPAPVRARLLTMLGQIQSIHFAVDAAAKEFFDAAEKLAPEDGAVLSAVGQFWQKTGNVSEAEDCFNRGIKFAPHIPNAYCDLGDLYDSQGKPEKAKGLYETAVKTCPGYSFGYAKLMSFLGRPQNLKEHESELLPLLQIGIIVSPEDEYQFYVDYGNIYLQALQFDKARESFQKAIDLDPARPYGLVFMAQSYEKEERFDKAKEVYRHLTVVAPDSYEGCFGLALLAQQEEQWAEALEWYQKTPRTVAELSPTFDARVGEMHARLKNYERAEEIATGALRTDRNNEAAKSVLITIAGDYYREQNKRAEAMRVYDQLFDIVGDSYAADYHNLRGNLSYFFEDYQQAASEYRLALKTADKPVFHRNLALACRQTKQYEEAAVQLEKALDLDKDVATYNKERSLLLNAEGNDFYALGDFRKSIDLYTKALACDATDDVIHSNLAGAWENLKEPGMAAEAIANAITSFQNAKSINPAEKYTLAIDKLSAKKAFLGLYGESANAWLPVVTPIAVEVAADLIPLVEGRDSNSLSEAMTLRLAEMRARVKSSYGVALPGVRFRGNETDFGVGVYVFLLGEIPIVSGTCKKDGRFFPGSKETLTAAGIDGEEQANPATREAGFWISEEDAKKIEAAGHELWDSADFILRQLESVLPRNLTDFLGHQEVFELVKAEGGREAEKELRSDRDKLTALTIVCHALLAEGVSITPFTEIYDQFVKLHAVKATPQSIVESIRSLPAVRPHLPGNDPQFSLFTLSPEFEASLKNTVYQSKTCSVLAIKPEDCQEVLAAIRNAVTIDRNLIVVHDPDLRPLVRLLLEIEFPQIPVLSERELQTDHEFKAAQVLDLEDNIENSESPLVQEASARAETVETVISDSSKVDPQVTVQVNEAFLENQSAADTQGLEQVLSLMRDGLFYELGVMIPEVKVTTNNALQPNQFRFRINGIESNIVDGLEFNQFLVNDNASRLTLMGVTGKDHLNPANSNQAAVVENENDVLQLCTSAGLTVWGQAGYLVLALSAEVRKQSASFQTIAVTRYMVELLRPAYPDLFDTVLKRFTLDQLTSLFKNLLDEGISIRDLRAIMEGLLSVSGTTGVDMSRYIVFLPQGQSLYPVAGDLGLRALTMENYTDAVRMSLKKYISHKYTRGSSTLMVYLMDPQSEKRFADTSRPLSDEEKVSFMDAVEIEVGSRTAISESATILTSIEVRRAIRNALKERFFNVAVISYQELSPETNIQPLARISWIPEPETSSEAVAN